MSTYVMRPGFIVLLSCLLMACQGTADIPGTLDQRVSPEEAAVEIDLESKNKANTAMPLPSESDASLPVSAIELPPPVKLPDVAGLFIPIAEDGILETDFEHFEVHILGKNGALPTLDYFDYFRIAPARDLDNWTDVTQYFEIADSPETTGKSGLVVKNPEAFRKLLEQFGAEKLNFSIYAEDSKGKTYSYSKEFFIGKHAVHGRLSAPPSNPALPVGGLTVTARYLTGERLVEEDVSAGSQARAIALETTTDVTGAFQYVNLIPGGWVFRVSTREGHLVYTGFAAIDLDTDKNLTLNLLTAEDLLDNEPGCIAVDAKTGVAPVFPAADELWERQALHDRIRPETTGFDKASILIGGAEVNDTQTGLRTVKVPAGTQTVNLTYKVHTTEYPNYVMPQSGYNDLWHIRILTADGALLFSRTHQINAQTTVGPVWQRDGATGEIVEAIDVSALTDSDVELILSAASTNIGDNLLPTYVSATLGFEPRFNIKSITRKFESNYISLPEYGGTNTHARSFRLEIEKPTGASLTKVTVSLVKNTDGGEIMTVVDEAPGVKAVLVNDNTLDVTITMDKNYPSSISIQPSEIRDIRYRFKLEADRDGTRMSDEKESEVMRPLWQLPEKVNRFGSRDFGADGWVSSGTYAWMETNVTLVPEVNDVSGEHGKNIGHLTHKRGTDIDSYHFTDFTGGHLNGTLNYLSLKTKVANALKGDRGALKAVTGWIVTARNHIGALTVQDAVREIIFGRGGSGAGLPDGWIRALMETGRLEVNDQVLDLNIGAWRDDKVAYRSDHNNHCHINLDDSFLEKR